MNSRSLIFYGDKVETSEPYFQDYTTKYLLDLIIKKELINDNHKSTLFK